jgi:hypothetical protein
MRFFIQTSVNVWKHKVCFKITLIWKVAEIVLETFYQKFILCVSKMINDFLKNKNVLKIRFFVQDVSQ